MAKGYESDRGFRRSTLEHSGGTERSRFQALCLHRATVAFRCLPKVQTNIFTCYMPLLQIEKDSSASGRVCSCRCSPPRSVLGLKLLPRTRDVVINKSYLSQQASRRGYVHFASCVPRPCSDLLLHECCASVLWPYHFSQFRRNELRFTETCI
jgi:hypothetical protein